MASTNKESKSVDDKKKRKRNKKLLGSIRQQIEFYFGDANLRKDRFLKEEISQSKDRYVAIATIASFNRMKELCSDPALIPQAVSTSDLLELSEDKTKVRRKTPVGDPEFDPDDVTVYVEHLPKTVDHDWLRKVFGVCGSVEYVSLPRYKSTGDTKGFAFIEFKTPDEANKACELLHNPPDEDDGKVGKFPKTRARKYLPVEEKNDENDTMEEQLGEQNKTDKKKPHDSSKHHKTHKNEQHKKGASEVGDGKRETTSKHRRKRHHSDEESDLSIKKHKHEGGRHKKEREKTEEVDGAEKDLKRTSDVIKKKEADSNITPHNSKDNTHQKSRKRKQNYSDSASEDQGGKEIKICDDGAEEYLKRTTEVTKKKEADDNITPHNSKDNNHKKSRKRKQNDSDSASEDHGGKEIKICDDLSEGERSGRNDNCKGRKEFDSEDKSRRKRVRKKKQGKKKESKEDEFQLKVISKRDWLELKHQYLCLQKANLAKVKKAMLKSTADYMMKADRAEKVVKSTEPEFTAGVVLKIESKKPIDSRQQLKDDLQTVAPVAYVDLQPGDQSCIVRCETVDGAKQMLAKYGADETSDSITVLLLTGEDEKLYWEKLKTDRQQKLNSKRKKKKKRGVDRLLGKAEKASFSNADKRSHVHFEDDE